jgi:hypothetical protein
MKEKLRFLGLDVHAETIAVAVAEPEGEVRSLGTIPNRVESIRKLIKKLGPADKLRACYEAGPTGYVVYWQLAYATGSTGLAITVRGSSRRIMIMRFRPANIRLINRRSKLLRLLLALSWGKENADHQNNP